MGNSVPISMKKGRVGMWRLNMTRLCSSGTNAKGWCSAAEGRPYYYGPEEKASNKLAVPEALLQQCSARLLTWFICCRNGRQSDHNAFSPSTRGHRRRPSPQGHEDTTRLLRACSALKSFKPASPCCFQHSTLPVQSQDKREYR